MYMLGGRVVRMIQGFSRKRSVTGTMNSHGHQQVLSITVTLTKVILFAIVSSMFMNNLTAYWLVVCVCRVILLGGFGPTNWH